MKAKLVYSSTKVKNHGGIIKDKQGNFVKKIMPFEISERIIDKNGIHLKTHKVVIRKGEHKIFEENDFSLMDRNEQRSRKSSLALIGLMKHFNSSLD